MIREQVTCPFKMESRLMSFLGSDLINRQKYNSKMTKCPAQAFAGLAAQTTACVFTASDPRFQGCPDLVFSLCLFIPFILRDHSLCSLLLTDVAVKRQLHPISWHECFLALIQYGSCESHPLDYSFPRQRMITKSSSCNTGKSPLYREGKNGSLDDYFS